MRQRIIDLEGAENVRDLGGYPTAGGATTRWGVAYRAASLHELTDADHETLEAIGVRRSFDLRGVDEAVEKPDCLPSSIERIAAPMSQSEAQANSMLHRIKRGELTEFTDEMMATGYVSMMRTYADQIRAVVTAVDRHEPLLFHCAAGKDRTGVVAMILLAVSGVDRTIIVDDYELTEQHRKHGATAFTNELVAAGVDPARFEAMRGAPRRVMELTLDRVAKQWGSVSGYLSSAGVDPEVQQSVAAAMTQR